MALSKFEIHFYDKNRRIEKKAYSNNYRVLLNVWIIQAKTIVNINIFKFILYNACLLSHINLITIKILILRIKLTNIQLMSRCGNSSEKNGEKIKIYKISTYTAKCVYIKRKVPAFINCSYIIIQIQFDLYIQRAYQAEDFCFIIVLI